MPGSLPKRIGPWRVEAEIGRGMMGVVYRARHGRRRLAAVKVVSIHFPISEEERLRFEKRFILEGRIVARLSHDGIVDVYDVGRDKKGAPYVAFEYLDGRTLAAMLSEGPAPGWRDSLRLVAQVARALHHAHSRGVIHRDVKPDNIMVLPNGVAKIMDFGLAKQGAGAALTSTGQFMGTPLYMSPEQTLGERLDARTDLFSLGSVAYTLLTGKRAFEGDSVPQVMSRVAYQAPPPPTRVVPTLPAAVDYLVARSMAKRPSDRYPTGLMFAEDVTDVVDGRSPRHSVGWTEPPPIEATVVSRRDPRPPIPEDETLDLRLLDDVDGHDRRSGSRSRVGSFLLLGLALVYLTAILFRSPFWVDRLTAGIAALGSGISAVRAGSSSSPAGGTMPTPSPTPVESVRGGIGEPSAAPVPSDSGSPAAEADDSASMDDVVVDDDAPDEAPSVDASPVQAPPATSPSPQAPAPRPSAAASARPARPMARFAITFEHHIQRGTLRVYVDRKLVLSRRLTSRVTKDLLLFKLRSGHVRNTLSVAPGNRRIRVEVRTPDDVRAKETVATFHADRTRRLGVKIGGLRGNLSFEWR